MAPFAVLIAAVWLVAGPLLRSHMHWRDVADAHIHLLRIYTVNAALSRGDLYPRWLPDLYLGYGYPLLNYYAPATYYLGSLLHRLGMTIYGSFQAIGALAVAAGALGTYLLVCRLTGGYRVAALFAAACYVLAPYPFNTNLYIRGALPEAIGLGLLPWLFLAAARVLDRDRAAVPALAAVTALLVLTHNITALIALGLLAVWLLAILSTARRESFGLAKPLSIAISAGLALSAFFWLPALAESHLVQLDRLRGGIYDYQTWLFDPLSRDPRADYPHTPLGPADLHLRYDYSALDRAVPARLSLGQLALWSFAVGVGVLAVWKRRGTVRPHPLTWAALAALCWFFNTTWSAPLWEQAPLLSLVQFPWRFYGPVAFCIAVAAGTASALLFNTTSTRRWLALVAMAALTSLLVGGSLVARPFLAAPDPPHDVDHRTLASEEYDKYGAGTTSGGEFLPRTVSWSDYDSNRRRGIRIYDHAHPQASWQAGLARVLSGRAAIGGIHQGANWVAVRVEADTPAVVAIHQLYFPGWRAFLNGQPIPVRPVDFDTERSASLGFMVVDVPAGEHQIQVRFGPTPIRSLATTLSAVSLAGAAAWYAGRRVRLRHQTRRSLLVALPASAALLVVAASLLEMQPHRTPAPDAARIALDLTRAVLDSQAETRSPIGAGRGALAPFLDVRHVSIAGENRRWLYMHPPSEVAVSLVIPPDAFLHAGLGVDPEAWHQDVGDGVRFIAEVIDTGGGGARHVILDRHLNPRANGDDRRWQDVWVSLSAFSGKHVRLVLRTEAGGDASFDWAGWAHPQIVAWRAARPYPGAMHPW